MEKYFIRIMAAKILEHPLERNWREGGRGGRREGWRERGREGWREGRREGGRGGGREEGREGGKEGGRERDEVRKQGYYQRIDWWPVKVYSQYATGETPIIGQSPIIVSYTV